MNAAVASPISGKMLRLAVLLSGSGRTLENLLEWIAAGRLAASVERVVSSRGGVRGVRLAERAGIPVTVLPPAGRPRAVRWAATGRPEDDHRTAACSTIT